MPAPSVPVRFATVAAGFAEAFALAVTQHRVLEVDILRSSPRCSCRRITIIGVGIAGQRLTGPRRRIQLDQPVTRKLEVTRW